MTLFGRERCAAYCVGDSYFVFDIPRNDKLGVISFVLLFLITKSLT